jgi:hypothetical protein
MRIHADPDPDPGQTMPSQKVKFFHLKYTFCGQRVTKHRYLSRYKVLLKCWKSSLCGQFPFSWIRIQIPNTAPIPDPEEPITAGQCGTGSITLPKTPMVGYSV